MVTRRRLRAVLFPLLLYCVSGAIGAYFVWQGVNGERGLKTKDQYERQIAVLQHTLEDLRQQHARWDRKIALMRGPRVDQDLLDEEARGLLGRSGRGELVVFLPQAK
jgi:cell division protein FtsB